LNIQKFKRRRKFCLHAAFLNASMISAVDAPVEFEVSIGNYGNKLDEHLLPCVSTTQPTNAVFDGHSYYYLPWGNDKPSLNVDCHWEDVLFRLETVNLLLGIAERLVSTYQRIANA
jgi:myoferlin